MSMQAHGHDHPLSPSDADIYAAWFACLAEPMRVRLLHTIASAAGAVSVGELVESVGIRQPTVSHHLRKLADVGFVTLTRAGTSTRVEVNPACCTGLPHAADAVMGMLSTRPCWPEDLPTGVTTRAMTDTDLETVREVCAPSLADGRAAIGGAWKDSWLVGHRWVAETGGRLVGWAAAAPVSSREPYTGVAETFVYVAKDARGRGVGSALLYHQVTEADAGGLWTLQTSIFPENRAGLALHHRAGFRTVGVRERIVRHQGVWRDTVLLERRRADTETTDDVRDTGGSGRPFC